MSLIVQELWSRLKNFKLCLDQHQNIIDATKAYFSRIFSSDPDFAKHQAMSFKFEK